MRKSTVILSAAVMALATAISMSPAQAAAFQVTASISTSSAQSGDGPIITGQLTPAVVHKVYLQRYYSDAWHNVATTFTNGSGQYIRHVTSSELGYKVGSLKFRAKVLADGGPYSADGSPSVTKTIYGWQSLAYMDAMSGASYRYVDGNDEFVADEYTADDSWQIKSPNIGTVGTRYTKWNLQEKCIRFQGFAGIDDDESVPGAVGRFIVSIDGTSHDTAENYGPNVADFFDVPIYKTHYLALKAYKLNGNATVIGVGEPEVLCSKKLPVDF
ncbi:hypothetical protein J2X11_000465 [Aeromicrobium panaciterrae]|uniref:Uncharacterized protein n=1 Tax=Aeromicrobium panaciterrae TaxID=363861 RepID=A0ABU1UKB8_9ACTN|nr:hypothetical protein [Aeromicrobium panaciterrae]MDR7085626.1 hypothetical protein [Aeromicrobium panaciterrae]